MESQGISIVATRSRSQSTSRSQSRSRSNSRQKRSSSGHTILKNRNQSFDHESPLRDFSRPISRASSVTSIASEKLQKTINETTPAELVTLFNNTLGAIYKYLKKSDNDNRKTAMKIIKESTYKFDKAHRASQIAIGEAIIQSIDPAMFNETETDITRLPPFDFRSRPCSPDEFDKIDKQLNRLYKRIDNNQPTELGHFFNDIYNHRSSSNLTDPQVIKLVTAHLGGRILQQFTNEIKRLPLDKVIYILHSNHGERISSAQESERFIQFKFTYKDLPTELAELRQILSLAYPTSSYEVLQNKLIDKVVGMIPVKNRKAINRDLNRREKFAQQKGLAFILDPSELDSIILYHCSDLTPRYKTNYSIHQVREVVEEEPPVQNTSTKNKTKSSSKGGEIKDKRLDKIFNVVSQVTEVIKQQQNQLVDLTTKTNELQTRPNNNSNFNQGRSPMNFINKAQNSFSRFNQNRFGQRQNPNSNSYPPKELLRGFRPRNKVSPNNQFSQNSREINSGKPFQLISFNNSNYPQIVDEIQSGDKVRFLGQKLQLDKFSASPGLKSQLRDQRPIYNEDKNFSPYFWVGSQYDLAQIQPFNGPIFKKVEGHVPKLTKEALCHFNTYCYACSHPACPGRRDPRCAYYGKRDSWGPCTRCRTGFHFADDCKVYLPGEQNTHSNFNDNNQNSNNGSKN